MVNGSARAHRGVPTTCSEVQWPSAPRRRPQSMPAVLL